MVTTIDLAASLAALTGVTLPADACVDSFDVSGALLGRPGAKGRDHVVSQDNGGTGNYGFRVGNWKIVRCDTKAANNEIVEQPLQRTNQPPFQLFDLSQDPGEKTNVLAQQPAVAEQMKTRLAALIAAGRSRE
jgi:arylsulfatase A